MINLVIVRIVVFIKDHICFSILALLKKGLLKNTGLFVGGAVGIMGFLYLLPEDVTSWNKKNFTFKSIFDKWKYNITKGPKFDNDVKFWNYVAHPYWGRVYYMSTRSLGYNPVYSFLYATTMSTFLWEYGFEALAEVPSIQDLILTPVMGSILGELFYLAKREIVKNDYHLLNSRFLGHLVNFLVDPSNELSNLLFNEKVENNDFIVNFTFQPNFIYSGKSGYNILLVFRF